MEFLQAAERQSSGMRGLAETCALKLIYSSIPSSPGCAFASVVFYAVVPFTIHLGLVKKASGGRLDGLEGGGGRRLRAGEDGLGLSEIQTSVKIPRREGCRVIAAPRGRCAELRTFFFFPPAGASDRSRLMQGAPRHPARLGDGLSQGPGGRCRRDSGAQRVRGFTR